MSKYCQELLRETLGGKQLPNPDYSDFGPEGFKGKVKKEGRKEGVSTLQVK